MLILFAAFSWGVTVGWFLHAFWPDIMFFLSRGKKG